MRILIGLALLLAIAVATVAGVIYVGLIDVAATASEPGPLLWLLETTRERSISRRAEGIRVPDLSRDALVAAGASAFDDMCAVCHGAPGQAPFVAAEDMNPHRRTSTAERRRSWARPSDSGLSSTAFG
jgi:mono/diheme cytochrome c family protein